MAKAYLCGRRSEAVEQPAPSKPFANLRARLGLRGIELYELADGSYLASRWGWSKALPDLRAVEGLAKQVGA